MGQKGKRDVTVDVERLKNNNGGLSVDDINRRKSLGQVTR
jgi:hypothetical protein